MTNPLIKANSQAEFYTPERCFITELLNSGDLDDLSVAQARVEPGVTTALHALDDSYEIYYILSGRGRAEIGGKDTGPVAGGDLVVIAPGVTQRIENTGEEDLVFLCICTPRFRQEQYRELE